MFNICQIIYIYKRLDNKLQIEQFDSMLTQRYAVWDEFPFGFPNLRETVSFRNCRVQSWCPPMPPEVWLLLNMHPHSPKLTLQLFKWPLAETIGPLLGFRTEHCRWIHGPWPSLTQNCRFSLRAVCPVCPVEKLPRRRIARHGASEKKPDGFASPGSGGWYGCLYSSPMGIQKDNVLKPIIHHPYYHHKKFKIISPLMDDLQWSSMIVVRDCAPGSLTHW
jgi:hypothetical protein